ncbi:response regulator transcription factor [Halorussus salinisoli]|uniref:response regulator transcription factor n=1 Tax=Halorussus salinisoli TaxID=2558242 RepID=UPI0010C1C684|nr:response regulator transcription factor [Halorussus salinisoli]
MNETPTILIVDDNRPLADGFARALPEEYEVLTAYTGKEARESFHEDVDAVLLDRRLPDVSGDELLDEIREGEFDCRIAVVSADQQSSDLDCDTYLTKPLAGPDVVRDTVEDLLDGNVSD